MKKALLLISLIIVNLSVIASDTLTIRQIFNYDIGDTFDYVYSQNVNLPFGAGGPEKTFVRYVITGKRFSTNNDSVFYTRHQVYPFYRYDSLFYTHLDSNVLNLFPGHSQYTMLIPDTIADVRITNFFQDNCGLCYSPSYLYGQGLGVIRRRQGETDGINPFGEYTETLIYFYKSGESYGTTYYDSIGIRLPHYTPIPEDCAFWNYTYSDPYNPNQAKRYYQIRTGSKVYSANHTFVELIGRSYDVDYSLLSPDSSLGYFRNDTAAQKVYFRPTITSADILLYDFTLYMSQTSSLVGYTNNYLDLDTIHIGSKVRVVWYDQYSILVNPYPMLVYEYIEGIGSTSGFVSLPVQSYSGRSVRSKLSSFCVCGEFEYPNEITASCYTLTGINAPESNAEMKLYPNPVSDILYLSLADASAHRYILTISDILGSSMFDFQITANETTHDIHSLPAGMYTYIISSDNTIIKTGKVVKQ